MVQSYGAGRSVCGEGDPSVVMRVRCFHTCYNDLFPLSHLLRPEDFGFVPKTSASPRRIVYFGVPTKNCLQYGTEDDSWRPSVSSRPSYGSTYRDDLVIGGREALLAATTELLALRSSRMIPSCSRATLKETTLISTKEGGTSSLSSCPQYSGTSNGAGR